MKKKNLRSRKLAKAKSPIAQPESDDDMGKWATYQKRGGSAAFGSLQAPDAAPAGFTAVTGGVGVITVSRVQSTPSPATGGAQNGMFFRAIDTTNQTVTVNGQSTLTGLVSGRTYKVQAAWFGNGQLSEWSAPILVAAG